MCARGLHVHAAADVIDSRELKGVEATGNVDGAVDLAKLRETGNVAELGVVGNGESATKKGKRGEGNIVELGVGDDGQGAANAREAFEG